MFVQIVRCKVKPGAWDQVEAWMRRWQTEEADKSPGYRGEYLLREKDAPDACIFVALFDDEAAAKRASDSPATNAYYHELMQLVEGTPEYISTEVVHHYLL